MRQISYSRIVLALVATLSVAPPSPAADEPAIQIDKEKRTVTIACKVAPRKLPNLSEIYPLEVVATYPAPRGQKAHETVVTFEVKPSDVHKAVESLGVQPGKPARGEGAVASGPEVKILLELPGPAGITRKVPIEKTLVDRKTGKTMPTLKWHFTGSVIKQPDPNKPDKVYGADETGTLIGIFPVTDEVVFQTNLTMKDEPLLKMDTNTKVLPPVDTPIKLIIQLP